MLLANLAGSTNATMIYDVILSSSDDWITHNVTKQRFPPAVVRLDNEQLQFHHIRGRSPKHTNESYMPKGPFSPGENFPPSSILSLPTYPLPSHG